MRSRSPSSAFRAAVLLLACAGLASARQDGAEPPAQDPPAQEAPGQEPTAQEPAQEPAAQEPPAATPPPQGDAPTVLDVEIVGNRRFGADQLVLLLGQRVGEPLDPRAIATGLHELGDRYRVRGSVDVREVEGGVILRLTVVELPFDLEPRFLGNVEVDREELYEWARISEGAELYLHQAPRIRERLLAAYRRHGYVFVEIQEVLREGGVDAEGRPIAPDVIFEIREGPQVHVRDVIIEGNEAMPDRGMLLWKDGLRKFAGVELAAPRLFGLFKDEFDEEALQGDVQAMRQVFRDRGWLDAVVQVEALEYSDDRGWVTIRIRVDQGPRYKVGSLAVETVERYGSQGPDGTWPERPAEPLFAEQELIELCELQPGEFFEARLQNRDSRALRDRYGERGHVFHESLPVLDRFEFLEPRLSFEPDAPVVHVTYRLAQGRQQFLREILVSGNTNTQDRVIRGRITALPGEVADLGEITRSRARIQSLGFFSDPRPEVEHVDPFFRFKETDDPSWKDLEFVVDEANGLGFDIAGGVSSSTGLFGIIRLKKDNFDLFDPPSSLGATIDEIADGRAFHGAGQRLLMSFSPGTRTSSFEVRFQEPDIFRRYDDRIGLDLFARRRFRRFESHDEEREEFGPLLRYQIGPDSSVSLGYTVGGLKVDDLDGGGEPTLGDPLPVPELLKAQEGDWTLAWLSAGFEHSVLDDYYFPQNGLQVELGVQLYDKALGSDFEFAKATAQWTHLSQIGEKTPDATAGYKLELQGGVALPYGDSDDVPYSERFFLGGQTLLRGFDFRGVGPNDEGFPLGGETYLAFTAEYRQPLIRTVQPGTFVEREVIHGGFFLDAGVLDPDHGSLDLDETRASAGVLLGLTIPLRFTLSYGVPIREGDGDDEERIQFNISLF